MALVFLRQLLGHAGHNGLLDFRSSTCCLPETSKVWNDCELRTLSRYEISLTYFYGISRVISNDHQNDHQWKPMIINDLYRIDPTSWPILLRLKSKAMSLNRSFTEQRDTFKTPIITQRHGNQAHGHSQLAWRMHLHHTCWKHLETNRCAEQIHVLRARDSIQIFKEKGR